MHDVQPDEAVARVSNASGTVARIVKPSDCHSATAATLVSTTALNCMLR